MSFFDTLITPETLASVRTTIAGYAQGAGLIISNWMTGAIGQQVYASVAQTVYTTTEVIAAVIRGYASLDTSTDPGDYDPYNPDNIDMTPASGMLSAYGENTYSTTRDGATFASGTFTFDNSAGTVPRTFGPGSLVFTWTAVSPPSPAPTYTNAADSSIYVNADGTVTVPAGSTLDIPITADVIGSGNSAPATAISLTTSFVGVTGTNASAVVGVDRETATAYRARCRLAPARTSLGGPPATYEYLATTNLDGTPLENASGTNVAINRVYVSTDSPYGIVLVYYADPTGVPSAEDVDAANTNISTNAYAVRDGVTFGPDAEGGAAATGVAITVLGTASIKAGPGVVSATVRQAIVDALTAAFAEYDIGGVDQTAGAGVIYTRDLQAVAAQAYVGLYNVQVTTPAGATTAIAVGHVATYAGVIANWTLTIT